MRTSSAFVDLRTSLAMGVCMVHGVCIRAAQVLAFLLHIYRYQHCEQVSERTTVRPRLSVLFYPDPSPSGRKSLVTDLQHMPCIHTACVFDYPVPSPIRIFFWKMDVCGYARSDCMLFRTRGSRFGLIRPYTCPSYCVYEQLVQPWPD